MRMAQHNERTRLAWLVHAQVRRCLRQVMQPCLFIVYHAEPSAHLLCVCVLFVNLLAIPTTPNIVYIFVSFVIMILTLTEWLSPTPRSVSLTCSLRLPHQL